MRSWNAAPDQTASREELRSTAAPVAADGENSGGREIDLQSLFQPDTLLADAYLDTVRRKYPLEPEKHLMLAVLEDALSCFQKNIFPQTEKEKALLQEAEAWIMEEGNDWLFSFETICEILNMNPAYLRQGLINWKRRKLAIRPNASFRSTLPGDACRPGRRVKPFSFPKRAALA